MKVFTWRLVNKISLYSDYLRKKGFIYDYNLKNKS